MKAKIKRMIHKIKVDSVTIDEMEYDNKKREVTLKFTSGDAYKYFGVEQNEWDKFVKAESKGSYFHKFKVKHKKFMKV